MSIKAFRTSIRIEKPVTRNEIDDEPTTEWVLVQAVMGRIRPMSATEAQAAGQLYTSASHVIETPFVKGAKSKWRLVKAIGGQMFNVNGVVQTTLRNGALRWNCYLEE